MVGRRSCPHFWFLIHRAFRFCKSSVVYKLWIDSFAPILIFVCVRTYGSYRQYSSYSDPVRSNYFISALSTRFSWLRSEWVNATVSNVHYDKVLLQTNIFVQYWWLYIKVNLVRRALASIVRTCMHAWKKNDDVFLYYLMFVCLCVCLFVTWCFFLLNACEFN